MARWQIPAMSRCKSCHYCNLIQLVSLGDPPPTKTWQRPLVLLAGLALTVCTVMAIKFAWARSGAAFFAAISSIVMLLGLVGVAVSFHGCDTCVARYLGRSV
jgi:hypothetical protein